MFLQRKLRFGAVLLIVGCLLAASGEIINMQTMDVLSSLWRFSLGLTVVGILILLTGLSTFATVSDRINVVGFIGYNFILLGGFLSIIGIVAFDWILVPFLVNLANTIASTINGPAISTQNALNSIIAKLNGLSNSIHRLFPGIVPHIPSAHIPLTNGDVLVNNALTQLHLPTIDRLAWLGHFSLAGGFVTAGCLILGLSLLRRENQFTATGVLLVLLALLNLLCQFLTSIPLYFGNITAAALFLTLGWLGLSAWSSRRRGSSSFKQGERERAFSRDKTLIG